ncbi:MAG: SDR family NAD(P)-dependent oxidoreductase [Chloroflexi bacterium]|nr:SDR family NAD(P)-dependent oxidoreductase [Chloroflexota bacterium]
MVEMTGRIVVVTGAAGNLGQAIARACQKAGANTALVDRAPHRLPELFPSVVGSAEHYLATGVDLTDIEALRAMVAECVARFGRIDALINTVGGYDGGTPVHETPPEDWERLFKLNVITVLNACRAVVPQMLSQQAGSIVNVASRSADRGTPRSGAYSAAKAALVRMTESMAAELKREGITVNCVLPGTIDTPQNRDGMPKADTSRWVRPEQVADVAIFLISEAASGVVGASVPVYGTG